MVANLQMQTKKMSYYTIEHASDSEFFSLSEFEEIASALLKTGLCLNVFYTEIDFVEYILKHYSYLSKETLLVYNLARDGRKEGKKSLIPSFCDYFSIDYTGSNALTVSLCRNKFIWGAVADRFNISTPKTVCIKGGEVLGEPFETQKYIRKEIFTHHSPFLIPLFPYPFIYQTIQTRHTKAPSLFVLFSTFITPSPS